MSKWVQSEERNAITKLARKINGLEPAVQESLKQGFEELCLEIARYGVDDLYGMQALLQNPAVNRQERMKLYLEKLSDKKIKDYSEDFYKHSRFVADAVEIGKTGIVLGMEAEKICLLACEHKATAMQEAGILGIEELYKEKPDRRLKLYKQITENPEIYKSDAIHNSLEYAFNIKAIDKKFIPEIKVISINGLVAGYQTGLYNLQKLALNIDNQYDGINGWDRLPFGSPSIEEDPDDLQNRAPEEIRELANLYLNIGQSDLFSPHTRGYVLERSVNFVKECPAYSQEFKSFFMTASVDLTLENSGQSKAWQGLHQAGFSVQDHLVEFMENSKKITKPSYFQAMIQRIGEDPKALKENTVDFLRSVKKLSQKIDEQNTKEKEEEQKNAPTKAQQAVRLLTVPCPGS